MEKPNHHILVCASFRPNGDPKGKCHRKNSHEFLPYIENEILEALEAGKVAKEYLL